MIDRCAGWLLPPRCVLCRRPGPAPGLRFVRGVRGRNPGRARPVPALRPAARSGARTGEAEGCAQCRALDLPYSRCVAPWAYEFPVTQLVQALKYEGALANARVFGTRMVAQALREQGDPWQRAALVVPMPLHPSRLVERGFNQSHEIARVVSRLLDLRLAGKGLRRIRSTAPQVGLSREERAGNLSGAFAADSSARGGPARRPDRRRRDHRQHRDRSRVHVARRRRRVDRRLGRGAGTGLERTGTRVHPLNCAPLEPGTPHAPPYLRIRLRRPA